ncbi:MAG: asparagine synthase (glutamine-hydrolyzing) [Magnetococcales bacterium]|nr:asparagine synthase (glutamine-hydrolyzing) [Magnetococcales bacterium]
MCGITGFLAASPLLDQSLWQQVITAMSDTLRHRGPDGGGVWLSHGVALGHRRLAIQDLTPDGAQPMVSSSGRYHVVFNGEIYNFKRLQQELLALGANFRGRSDTEVLLAAVEHWGLAKAVESFIGMFAFALWDQEQQKLFLVRDRLGVKPLYYGQLQGGWIFASELKSFKAYPHWSPQVDRRVLARYLALGYIPAPWTIWQNIFKVQPGCWLEIALTGEVRETTYWSLRQVAQQGLSQRSQWQDTGQLESLLADAVSLRMISDAPLGAFLSGGIDSSLVVALMQRERRQPVRTFAMGFAESEFNEAHHARQVAACLGTDHQEWLVTPQEARNLIPELPRIYDEPFADPSQIPTALVCRLARQQVTVCLSGDGGDELLAGYNRYGRLQSLWPWLNWMPDRWRQQTGKGIRAWLQDQPGRYSGWLAKLDKGAAALAAPSHLDFYHALFANWLRASEVVVDGGAPWSEAPPLSQGTLLDNVFYRDIRLFLADDILVKVDRASMDVGLEVRGPLLDHRLAELAWSMPLTVKRQGMVGKLPLRRMLYNLVPRELVDRPKQGFAVPLAAWLRGPLKEWAADMMQPGLLQRQGYLRPEPIAQVWQSHLQGQKDWSLALWTILMWQSWLQEMESFR